MRWRASIQAYQHLIYMPTCTELAQLVADAQVNRLNSLRDQRLGIEDNRILQS